jgi:hypothetical protein
MRTVAVVQHVGAVAHAGSEITVGDEGLEREGDGVPRKAELTRENARRR